MQPTLRFPEQCLTAKFLKYVCIWNGFAFLKSNSSLSNEPDVHFNLFQLFMPKFFLRWGSAETSNEFQSRRKDI